MATTWTQDDFDRLSWHDNAVYGFHLAVGDPERSDWRSDLVFDIDFILEWSNGVEGRYRFRIAPATLTFHHATDLDLSIDWGHGSARQIALSPICIARIDRSPVAEQRVCLDRPYFRWWIDTNWPDGGSIAFGASGFTQVLRAPPIVQDEQSLPPASRPPFQPR